MNRPKQIIKLDFETKLKEIKKEFREILAQQKKLESDIKQLFSLHKKDLKLQAKSGNRTNSGKYSGFNKPEVVPQKLQKLLKIKRTSYQDLALQVCYTNTLAIIKLKKFLEWMMTILLIFIIYKHG